MVMWTISADTLHNVGFPREDDGVLIVRPEIVWGAGQVLSGDEFPLFLPASGTVPESGGGDGEVRAERP